MAAGTGLTAFKRFRHPNLEDPSAYIRVGARECRARHRVKGSDLVRVEGR